MVIGFKQWLRVGFAAVALCATALPAAHAQVPQPDAARCDACNRKVDSLAEPLKLGGTWLFTRDDKPENALPGIDTSAWKVIKAPGPWKKAYDDKNVYSVGWYRGHFEFAPALVGQEVVLLLNTYMAHMSVYVDGKEVFRRPHNASVERYYSIQAAPIRFVIPKGSVDIAIRVDTPLMTGVYQLPFEIHKFDPNDGTLVAWSTFGGELRATVGWVAFFFGLFFAQVFLKTRYALYLVASLGSFFGWWFLIIPADYLMAVLPTLTLTFLHYLGLYGVFFFFLFAQFFYKFYPRVNKVVGVALALPAIGIASMALHTNLPLFQTLRSIYFILLLFLSLATVYVYFRGVLLRKPGSAVMLFGMVAFAIASVNDVLLGVGVIQSISLGASGLTICLAAMLFVSIQSFANTFVENKRLLAEMTDINENLETLVASRTAALREKTNDIQAMLQNMPQGVLTVTAGGKVHPEYSAYLEQIFETQNVAGRDAMELLFGQADLGADARSQVEVSIASVIGEDRMNFDFNSHLLVAEAELKLLDGRAKSLEMSWSPICNEGDQVDKLMVCVRDVTELRRLAAESAGQKRELELIGQILAVSQEKFQAFMESTHAFVEENRSTIKAHTARDAEAVNLLFRNMHTIKGNARTYGLLHLTNTVHEAEAAYDELRKDEAAVWDAAALLAQLDEVAAAVDGYARINNVTLGRKGPGRRGTVEKFLMVDKADLATAVGQLHNANRTDLAALGAAVAEAERVLRRLGTESLTDVLAGVTDSLPSLAQELGKRPPQMEIDDGGLALKAQLAGLVRNLFTHLLRNAVDHGIETPEDRQAAGKAPTGRIRLQASLSGEHYTLRLSDDGRGLALNRIRERAVEANLVSATTVLSDEDAAELIFLPGFSTADHVTEVSGRGVGMDAVRDFLAREGGDISLRLVDGAVGAPFRAAEFLIELPAAAVVAVN